MSKKTRLTQKMIDRIVELYHLHVPWSNIASAIGVHRHTLANWLKKGETSEGDIFRRLYLAIEKAETDRYIAYASVVTNEALNGKVTVTMREYEKKDGTMGEDTITKQESPNADLAQSRLAVIDPLGWGAIQRIEVNWREEVKKQGIDPDTVKGEFRKQLVAVLSRDASEASLDADDNEIETDDAVISA